MRPVVAIDAHKESCTYVVRHWNKTKAGPKRIPSTRAALTKLALAYPAHDFVLEVCAVHEWMMDLFREHDINAIAVIPPKAGPVGKKSDDDDATRLAKKHQAGELQEVHVAGPEVRTMRDIIRDHEFLKSRSVSINNHLRSALNRWNFKPVKRGDAARAPGIYAPDGRAQILERFPHLESMYNAWDAVLQERIRLRKQIDRLGRPIPEVQIIRSIKGFGPIISLALYIEIDTIHRFDKATRLVRYFGLDPLHGSSGDKHWDAHRISKKGVSYMRGLLAQGAWSHVTRCPDSDIAQNYERLRRRGKTKQQALMMVMRRLVKAVFWMLKEEREFTINGPARSTTCRNPASSRVAALISVEREAPAAVR